MEQNNKQLTDVEVKIKDENSNREIWLKKCYRPLILMACAILIFILIIIVIVLAAVLSKKSDGEIRTEKDKTCQTQHCIKTASRLLGSMNTKVNPCENFYEFACGKWVESHRVPEDKGSIDTMEEVSDRLENDLQDLLESKGDNDIGPIEKAKTFYRSCMDQESMSARGNQDILKFIKELGGWPVLDESWNPATFDLEASIAGARHYTTNYVWPIPHGIIMGLNILNDYRVYGDHVIYFDQPSLLMEGRDMYLDSSSGVFPAYIKYTKDVAIALGAEPSTADRQMRELVEFETEIAKISVAVSDRRDMNTNYRRMNITTLTAMYPKFDWLKYLRKVFTVAGVTINNSEPVVLWMKPYFDKLFPLLDRTKKRTVANYIVWRIITKQFDAMEKLNLMRLEFRKVTEGVKQLKPTGQRCAESTNKYLDLATGRLYAEKNFGPREREHMLDMISYLRRIFRDIIKTAEWMDSKTKEYALKKPVESYGLLGYLGKIRRNGNPDMMLEKMKSLIGFPSSIFNNTILTEYYEQISFSPSNFFENMKSIRKYVGLKQLSELRQPSYEKWPERPAIVNAFYHSGLNAIVFPAGILQSPYYDIHYPASVNFGGIGLVIGHEITHGYDASGRSFDADGLLHNWWTDFSLQNFNTKTVCVVDHYSNFEVPNINMNINGNTTLSENIADIGGVKQSHMAYKLWLKEHGNKDVTLPGLTQYSHEQLFFINTAQLWCSRFTDEAAKRSVLTSVHSLPMFRVLGELRNSHGFSEVFNCPRGTYMNPNQEKCSLW